MSDLRLTRDQYEHYAAMLFHEVVTVTAERDEALAEVERLRLEISPPLNRRPHREIITPEAARGR